ncbi:MAG: DUF1513 domain-containing protein, partial [Rhodocyclaceae bacterium]
MDRRSFLGGLSACLATPLFPSLATAAPIAGSGAALIAAWRSPLRLSATGEEIEAGPTTDYVGILAPDWDAGRVRVRQAIAVPNRVHGLLADPGGGFFAVAYRPGKWLMRVAADGTVGARIDMAAEGERTLEGHGVLSPDGQFLITTETRPESGEGWISVRDRRSLKKQAEWRTHGIEPHDARFDAAGRLIVANGGILRAPGDKKRDLDAMDSSLVRLDIASGELLGRWRLRDPRLSLRHLAVSAGSGGGKPLAGVALQAEHDDAAKRAAAPILAVWDGERLEVPTHIPLGMGYCSDIVPGQDGGFYLNGERADRVF